VAAQSGISSLIDRSQTSFTIIEENNVKVEYKLIRLIKFTSERRMMSMVVEDSAGKLFVFSKGADSAILPLIADIGSEFYVKTVEHMEKYAEQGMRTLVFAFSCLDLKRSEVENFEDNYFERNLTLIAATGVEDMLQEDVHKCITDFQEAGVRTWIVTGDKNSTAKCIGYTSGVFSPERNIVTIDDMF
jgi:magnesium-transporting ATPase (P-type)